MITAKEANEQARVQREKLAQDIEREQKIRFASITNLMISDLEQLVTNSIEAGCITAFKFLQFEDEESADIVIPKIIEHFTSFGYKTRYDHKMDHHCLEIAWG